MIMNDEQLSSLGVCESPGAEISNDGMSCDENIRSNVDDGPSGSASNEDQDANDDGGMTKRNFDLRSYQEITEALTEIKQEISETEAIVQDRSGLQSNIVDHDQQLAKLEEDKEKLEGLLKGLNVAMGG